MKPPGAVDYLVVADSEEVLAVSTEFESTQFEQDSESMPERRRPGTSSRPVRPSSRPWQWA